jgi:hypothetical protein
MNIPRASNNEIVAFFRETCKILDLENFHVIQFGENEGKAITTKSKIFGTLANTEMFSIYSANLDFKGYPISFSRGASSGCLK